MRLRCASRRTRVASWKKLASSRFSQFPHMHGCGLCAGRRLRPVLRAQLVSFQCQLQRNIMEPLLRRLVVLLALASTVYPQLRLLFDDCGSDNTRLRADVHHVDSQCQVEIHALEECRVQLVCFAPCPVSCEMEQTHPPKMDSYVRYCLSRDLSHAVLPSLPIANNETITGVCMLNLGITA